MTIDEDLGKSGRSAEGRSGFQRLIREVTFDHVSNNRIRHGTKVSRWRDDKDPRDCRTDQLD